MNLKQVIVVAKFESKDSSEQAAQSHRGALKTIQNQLRLRGIALLLKDRHFLKHKLHADLIVTVGGDGTVLAASHFAGMAPILGVNSSPKTSTGFFCGATPLNFARQLDAIFEERLKPKEIPRLKASVGGRVVPWLALNDILFASRHAGDTCRYELQVGAGGEFQKSSGVWVSTSAGSTAAIYSAGGKRDSLFSSRIQYLVREPFRYPRISYRLLKGFLPARTSLTIIPRMKTAALFIDGPRMKVSIPEGVPARFRGGAKPLKLYL